jgi:hypothetical protein
MGEAGKRAATYGAGTIFKRGRIWYGSYYMDGQQFIRSTRSTSLQKAKQFRDQILGRKARGELTPGPVGHTTCGELLDDVLEYPLSPVKVNAATNSHDWQGLLEYQMLNRLFRPPEIHGSVFYVQQDRLDFASELLNVSGDLGFDLCRHLLRRGRVRHQQGRFSPARQTVRNSRNRPG